MLMFDLSGQRELTSIDDVRIDELNSPESFL